jgi:3-hydroxyisobutyrate dehydrogenase
MNENAKNPRIVLIGLGEVGRCFAAPLHDSGFAVSACEISMKASATELAKRLGTTVYGKPGAWLQEADQVMSCVTGDVALSVARDFVPFMKKGAQIVDMTTASPDSKRQSEIAAQAYGVRYLDVAIMGGIPLAGVRTPLLAAGQGAAEFGNIVDRIGGHLQVIADGKVGDAISLKFLRTIFTKGLEALSVEMLISAEKQGVREKLYAQLSDIDQKPLRSFIDSMVRTHVIHAKRRAHEVQDAQKELSLHGLPSVVLPGVEERFHKTVNALSANPLTYAEPSVEQAIDWLLATSR